MAAARLDPSKADEARKAMAEGESALKTSLLRWKPDYLEAQPAFAKAAKLFKSAGLYDSAVDAYRKACSCSMKLGNLKQAALTFEDAARDLALVGPQYKDTAADFLLQAAAAQMEAGDVVRAVDLKMRAGKLFEGFNNDKAAKIYDEAANSFDGDEEKDVYAADALKKIFTHQLAVKRHASAVRTMDKLTKVFLRLGQPHNIHKLILSRVVLLLADGDAVAAMNEYTRHLDQPGFAESKEAAAAEDLIHAYSESNPDAVKKVAEQNVFNFLENPITRLARGLAANCMTGAAFGSAHDGERATKAVGPAPETIGGFTVVGGSLGSAAAAAKPGPTSERATEKARQKAETEAAARAALFAGAAPRPAAAAAPPPAAGPAPAGEEDYDYESAFKEMGIGADDTGDAAAAGGDHGYSLHAGFAPAEGDVEGEHGAEPTDADHAPAPEEPAAGAPSAAPAAGGDMDEML